MNEIQAQKLKFINRDDILDLMDISVSTFFSYQSKGIFDEAKIRRQGKCFYKSEVIIKMLNDGF
tara:strand:- start:386 stop:577 length:192 start_codon:yes stop_codon:yes gene_type:complete